MQTSGLSAPKARLVEQLIENFGPSKATWDGNAAPLEELAGLDDADQSEVLDAVRAQLGTDNFVKEFMPRLEEVGKAVSAFADQQSAVPGMGAAAPSRASVTGVDLRAAEQVRLQAMATAASSVSDMPITDLTDKLIAQKESLRTDVSSSDIPADVKKKLLASLDTMDVVKLQSAAGRFEMAQSRLNSRADRLRPSNPERADGALSEMNGGVRGSIAKMASEMRGVSRADSILHLINSNMPIEKLLLLVMLLMFEGNDEELREKLRQQQEANKAGESVRLQRTSIENAKTPDAVDKAIAASEAARGNQELMQDAVEDIQESQSRILGDDKPANETEEQKEDTQKAHSGEASGAKVIQEKAISGSKKDGTQLSLFTLEDLAPPSPQLSLDFAAPPPVVVSPPKNTDDGESTGTVTGQPEKPPAKPNPPRPPPPGSLQDRRDSALRNIDDRQRTHSDAVAKINFEVQALVDQRKQSLDLISKLMSDLAAMAQTVIRNMQ